MSHDALCSPFLLLEEPFGEHSLRHCIDLVAEKFFLCPYLHAYQSAHLKQDMKILCPLMGSEMDNEIMCAHLIGVRFLCVEFDVCMYIYIPSIVLA